MDGSTIQAPELADQNFALAVPAGLVAALIGAVIWAAVTYVTQMEIGLIAVAVGALTGVTVKRVGRGVGAHFGFLGAGCAALGWALGMLLSDIAFLANTRNLSLLEAAQVLNPAGLVRLAGAAFQPMDLLFLGIAVYEGYKFSFERRRAGQ
jgi:hypothetical protein